MSAGEIGMLVLNAVAFLLLLGLCTAGLFYIVDACKGALDERQEREERGSSAPAPDKEARAVAEAADAAGKQAATKARMWFAFQRDLREMRSKRWDQQ